MRRPLARNTQALSVMYDAVLFVVMVSLAGVILLPAMQSNIAVQTSIEKHREELVDETLLMLMTSRADHASYTFAGSQIDDILGGLKDIALVNGTIQALLGKQLLHKTYADLLAENMVSQLRIFGYRVNFFTDDYDQELKNQVGTVLTNHMGGKYAFNLSVLWHPISGLPFGGELTIGRPCPQKNTYVAHAYISLPENSLSGWLKQAESHIKQMIQSDPMMQNITQYLTNFSATNQSIVRESLFMLCNETINDLLFDGFNITMNGHTQNHSGVVNTTIEYIFQLAKDSIRRIFDSSLGRLDDFFTKLDTLKVNLSAEIEDFFITTVSTCLNQTIPGGFTVDDPGGDGVNLSEFLHSMKIAITNWAKSYLHGYLAVYIKLFVDAVMTLIGPMIDSAQKVSTEMLTFFSQRTGVLRAEVQLTIWAVRE